MYCGKCGKKLPDEAKFCTECGAKQKIIHAQEEPEYEREYLIESGAPIFVGKIFAIDDESHSTMLLAEEY